MSDPVFDGTHFEGYRLAMRAAEDLELAKFGLRRGMGSDLAAMEQRALDAEREATRATAEAVALREALAAIRSGAARMTEALGGSDALVVELTRQLDAARTLILMGSGQEQAQMAAVMRAHLAEHDDAELWKISIYALLDQIAADGLSPCVRRMIAADRYCYGYLMDGCGIREQADAANTYCDAVRGDQG